MDRGAWWATVHGGHKELDTTEVTKQKQDVHILCFTSYTIIGYCM